MGNLITIYKGDENRAKMDTGLDSKDFFGSVYSRAFRILEKIVCETRTYRKANSQTGYKPRFQGMGNNIIIFTAERGQGKTSAMQSFAESLRHSEKYSERLTSEKSVAFYVLDAIDPAALDKRENIIRVLLSRLYFEFDKYGSDCGICETNVYEKTERSESFLKLLMDCYDNIETLKNNFNKEDDEDDLEHLAQMGNSAKLKENLNNLIDKFLKLLIKGDYEQRYLVIQIDDVDLSTGDIYDICEDIHRYFSVPSVVVLMAADYSQLRYAIYEKYLKQYKELQNEHSKIKIYDKCHDMATRYLEKVFPEGHIIELPVMQNMMAEDYAKLRIRYLDGEVENKRQESMVGDSENLCAYLLRAIYRKTGLILLNTKERIHPLLPRTMRELAHLLNLLDEMPDIDFISICRDKVEGNAMEDSGDQKISTMNGSNIQKEEEKWMNNLFRWKRYYFYDWCTNYLDEKQWDQIQAIEACEPESKLQLTVSLLKEYMILGNGSEKTSDTQEICYYTIMHQIMNNKAMKKYTDFQYALLLYYGLFLNEWFVRALRQKNSMQRLMDFTGSLIYADEKLEKCLVNGFKVNFFEVSVSRLEKRITRAFKENINPYSKVFLQVVLAPGTKLKNVLYFDYFRLLTCILLNQDWQRASMENLQTMDDMDVADDRTNIQNMAEIMLALKNIITNFQVQQKVQEGIEEFIAKCKLESQSDNGLLHYYGELNDILDSWIEGTEYTTDIMPTGLGKFLMACFRRNGCMNDIFLSNEENISTYRDYYAKNICKALEQLENDMNSIKKELESGENGNKSADQHASLEIRRIDYWYNLRPKLIDDLGLDDLAVPDDDKVEEYRKNVYDLKVQYDSIIAHVNEYLDRGDVVNEEPIKIQSQSSEAENDAGKMVNTTDRETDTGVIDKCGEETMRDDKISQHKFSDVSEKEGIELRELIDDIKKYIEKIQTVRSTINASGKGKS